MGSLALAATRHVVFLHLGHAWWLGKRLQVVVNSPIGQVPLLTSRL